MITGFEFIGTFKKEKQANGDEYYTGVLDPALVKKAKPGAPLVLIPGALLPAVLVGRTQDAQDCLHLFSRNDGSGQ